ncbi:uncharacterized protein C12orf56 homolog [Lampris incognitus]|uniref:uncharacterized protein C12orf56 homolog n=1 Tax=Lampris incognitus TaxID=2546036 RepID=UPI0024B4A973|nr:uncharacterized protein C12orf56 homolog [Lampris incognitus]
MARTGSGRNSKLDSFLKRNTDRAVYERIRAYEPCVVMSESVNKVFMHVVLSDECVYLAEYPPRALTAAVRFSQVRHVELVNDLPDFLSGKDRERCQHIRVVYVTTNPAGRKEDVQRKDQKRLPALPPAPPRSYQPSASSTVKGDANHLSAPPIRNQTHEGGEELQVLKTVRSASCPDPETLSLRHLPRFPIQPASPTRSLHSPVSPILSPTLPSSASHRSPKSPEPGQVTKRRGSVLARLLMRERVSGGERDGEGAEREAELHLYAVSQMSRIYLHLHSSWNSFVIRSTLILDPLHRKRCGLSSSPSPHKHPTAMSWERTAHLFWQLSAELLQQGISLESQYLLLQELRTAAHRNTTLRKLFWRSSDVCVFLVQTLEDSMQSCQSSEVLPTDVLTTDQLLLSTLITQTLAVMFRETEVEPARLSILTAKKGALTVQLLLAVVCDPELHTHQEESSLQSELRTLLAEYLDAACSLLFELVVLGQEASRCSSAEVFLTLGWIFRVLQPHPHLLSFIGYQAQQVVLVLSDPQLEVLSPTQSVLLYQRCRVLLACLQYSCHLGQHLRSHFREEFRYYVKPSCAEEKLPLHYPISQPAQKLVTQLLTLILQ